MSRKLGLAGLAVGVASAAAAVAVAAVLVATRTAHGSPPQGGATAVSVPGIRYVGPLFDPADDGRHSCTASVVHSPSHDLIVTVAHCISGTAVGTVFAPGYDDGATPYGTWTVRQAYVDPRWVADQDPHADYAFLVVAPTPGSGAHGPVEDAVGAARLGQAPGTGRTVRVDGYAEGSNDRPLTCTNTVTRTDGFPTFACHGYVDGTSGGPWLTGARTPASRGTIVGVTGGLHQGGCDEAVSYSSPFDQHTRATYLRATRHEQPDVLPAAGDDGC